MSNVVIDIETVGFDFDSFSQKDQDYLLKNCQDEEEKEKVKNSLALSSLTGEVVSVAMLNPETERGMVFFQDKNSQTEKFEENGILYEAGNEKVILEKFWELVKTYDRVITFNGRCFDIPFLMIRSALNKVRVSKNLLGYRYEHKIHCDLLDQLTFYGATRRYSLDFYTKRFGIKSPKEEGLDGSMVGDLYEKGKYTEIARYCTRDVLATGELFDYWNKYLRF